MCDCNNSELKITNFELNKVSDTEYLATVDEYTFKVRSLPLEGEGNYGTVRVRLFEVDDKLPELGTIIYRGLPIEHFTPGWIENFIAKNLAKHTNVFKENS